MEHLLEKYTGNINSCYFWTVRFGSLGERTVLSTFHFPMTKCHFSTIYMSVCVCVCVCVCLCNHKLNTVGIKLYIPKYVEEKNERKKTGMVDLMLKRQVLSFSFLFVCFVLLSRWLSMSSKRRWKLGTWIE